MSGQKEEPCSLLAGVEVKLGESPRFQNRLQRMMEGQISEGLVSHDRQTLVTVLVE